MTICNKVLKLFFLLSQPRQFSIKPQRIEILPVVLHRHEAECVFPPGDLTPSQLLISCSLLSLHTASQ